ncbi:mannose-1-phosphate guanylyltransferase [Sediminivirga luteola]|uniref:Mannose-1-phosphate guanyltransferase n=1 Tax=Sediminivirga luteola TaxID=1774748 RepID=A0A8J2TX80_9MICO|nr:mannose-1-phosphate guanylyltransferase [Sediminivirga luteola]MCI2265424.1 mannose-1-phosphate guanylyltransferase [Sediminivirga luteola]GGA11288.1 mannose-1-phosphate guanyltransferase [Sediminivirga luteola]
MREHFHAVIPAGGHGTRLWPLSRQQSPKFLHDLLGAGRSLLQSTWDRLVPLADPERIHVVTGEAHAEAVRAQLPDLPEENLVREPSPKDSAAAIGLAAELISRRDPEAIIGSFAADHSITNQLGFHEVIREAIAAAAGGEIVTVGVTPTFPATGYGYIRTGEPLDLPGAPSARRAGGFVEKPKASTARRYVFSGRYRWNAGMFISRADAMLAQIEANAPELRSTLALIASARQDGGRADEARRLWDSLEKRAIDYVVAEPAAEAGKVIVIPGDFGWDDVGDFASVASLRQPVPGEGSGVFATNEDTELVSVDASGVVLSESDRLVALVGVEDLVVVDTADVLLVTTRRHAQRVKQAVEEVRRSGREDLL